MLSYGDKSALPAPLTAGQRGACSPPGGRVAPGMQGCGWETPRWDQPFTPPSLPLKAIARMSLCSKDCPAAVYWVHWLLRCGSHVGVK